jgi:hypothetical protein
MNGENWRGGSLRLRTKILLILCGPFFCFFAFGVTEFGQRMLRGSIQAGADPARLDDIYMGAGLAPWVYGFVPFVPLFLGGLISWFLDLRRELRRKSN